MASRGRRSDRPARALLLSVPVALTLFVVGIAGIATSRFGPLPMEPWGYLALALAGVGAVSSMLLGIVRLTEVS